jgi:hypothetical protein
MSLAHVEKLRFGHDIVFTYGPLGFLARPQEVFLGGALLGIAYSIICALVLYALVLLTVSRWLPVLASIAVTAVFAFFFVVIDVPELAAIALLLYGLRMVEPDRRADALRPAVAALLGALAALQLQVKFGVGIFFVATIAVIALSRPKPVRSAAAVGGAFLGATPVLWLLAGQQLGDLVPWLRASVQLTSGYSDAMATNGTAIDRAGFALLIAPAVVLALGVALVLHREGSRRTATAALVAVGSWYAVKQGFVRQDAHRNFTFATLAGLLLAIRWRGWQRLPAIIGDAVDRLAHDPEGCAPSPRRQRPDCLAARWTGVR